MFPYNDDKNAWISKPSKTVQKPTEHGFVYTLVFGLFVALFSTIISPLIYFLRIS